LKMDVTQITFEGNQQEAIKDLYSTHQPY